MAYRSTPHSATGRSPAELMMGRRPNDVIPAIKPSQRVQINERQLREVDATAKAAMKRHADASRRPRRHEIREGDIVLRRRVGARKTQTPFESDAWRVQRVAGNSLLLRRGDATSWRHCTAVKVVTPESFGCEEGSPTPEVAGRGDDVGDGPVALRSHPRAAKEGVKHY